MTVLFRDLFPYFIEIVKYVLIIAIFGLIGYMNHPSLKKRVSGNTADLHFSKRSAEVTAINQRQFLPIQVFTLL
ncbi:hypothetical protein Hs20B_16740 [Lactococcus insecticola]|uniref:Uncharacterized protein n=1 Tax=Pseudolactococcus insecticola TaxID=2709158 RepID=A0A6A0B8V6_9LACT|nr:hypothetical protein Hs20B_16740 [Lactococcus insecticola]